MNEGERKRKQRFHSLLELYDRDAEKYRKMQYVRYLIEYLDLHIKERKERYEILEPGLERDYVGQQIFTARRLLGVAKKLKTYQELHVEYRRVIQGLTANLELANEILDNVVTFNAPTSSKIQRPRSKWVVNDHLNNEEIKRISQNIKAFLSALPTEEELEKGEIKEALGISEQISEVWTNLIENNVLEVDGHKVSLVSGSKETR